MSSSKALDAAVSGINRAGLSMLAAATNTGRSADPTATSVEVRGDEIVESGQPVDMIRDIVDIKMAKLSVQANTAAIRHILDTEKKLLDILG